jgi:autotransporter-associated beta strand protein
MKNKYIRNSARFLTSISLCLSAAQAAEIAKLQNTNQLDNGASWSGGVVPGAGDVMLWDATFTTPGTAASLAQIGSSLSVAGLKVTNVGGTRNAATTMVGFQNTGSSATLTIGDAGIDLSTATQSLIIQSRVTIGADHTWNIANANTATNPTGLNNNEDLSLFAQAATVPFDFNGKTVTTTGVGQLSFTSGYDLRNGNFNVGNNLAVVQGGSSRLTTIANTLNVSIAAGSTLRLQSNSGSINSAAPMTVNGLLLLLSNNGTQGVTQSGPITAATGATIRAQHGQAGPITVSGNIAVNGDIMIEDTAGGSNTAIYSGNLTGAGNIRYANTATGALGLTNLTGTNSGFTGTVTVNAAAGNRILRLGSATAGSAAATWSVNAGNTLQVDGVNVELGTLTGAGTITNSNASIPASITVGAGNFSGIISDGATATTGLTKTGPGTLTLSGASTYTGLTRVNGGTLVTSTLQEAMANSVNVVDGANFGVNVASLGDDLILANLTTGNTTGATLSIRNGALGNPTIAPVFATNFTVNAPTVIDLTGYELKAGTFPLIDYTTLGGTAGYAGLSLKLPPRTLGTLVNNPNSVAVNITSAEGIKWKGDVNTDWDIDSTGLNTEGTPNWITTATAAAARFLQGAAGTDAARFDDSAAGTGAVTVNLTTTLTPAGVMMNNPTRDYTFTGSGKLSGDTSLIKDGAASLTLANTSPNDYIGGTQILAGSLVLGDATTAGAGEIAGAVVNEGTLTLNRPDDHTLNIALSGMGALVKNNANTVTIGAPLSYLGPVTVNGGVLRFSSGGALSNTLAGAGSLENAAGTLSLSGTVNNTNTGDTIVSGGSLRLEMAEGINAVGGNIIVQGPATLVCVNNEQIPDTANLFILGTSGDSMLNSTGVETVNNVTVNPSDPAGQLVIRNNLTALGTAKVSNGVMGVASGHICNLNAVVIDSPTAILRVAGSAANSTMNIGAGGVTASAGVWQIKFNTNNFDAVVNLGGDFTATGDFSITNAGYTGVNLNVINLTGSRKFIISANTTTSIAPDLGDIGDLVKEGDGKLVLTNACTAGHTGATTVSAGSLIVNGTMPNAAPTVAAGATLGGSGTITADTTVPSGATLAPGDATAATLNFGGNVTLEAGSNYAVDITAAATSDRIATATGTLSANGNLVVTLTGYVPVENDSFDLADAAVISGTPTFDFSAAALSPGLQWDTSQFATTGVISVKAAAGGGFDSFASVIPNPDDRGPLDDPDGDFISNLMEYVLGGSPIVPAQDILPTSSVNATEFVFSFKRSDDSENDSTQVVEIGSTLSNWTAVPIVPAGVLPAGVTIEVVENGAAPDTVNVKIDRSLNAASFARLKVVR